MVELCYCCFELLEWYSPIPACGEAYPTMKGCDEFLALGVLKPDHFCISVKVKAQKSLGGRILSLLLEEFLFQDWIITMIRVGGGETLWIPSMIA